MSVGVSLRNQIFGVLVNISIFGTLTNVTVGVDQHVHVDEYLDIRACSCRDFLFVKLVLLCGDEILYTTKTLIDDKRISLVFHWYFICN